MIDLTGETYLSVLTRNELCFLSLTKEQNLNMQRIQYRDLKYIRVSKYSSVLKYYLLFETFLFFVYLLLLI